MPAPDDHALAAQVAGRAAELLMSLRDRARPADAAVLGTEGDRRSHELITTELRRRRPDDAVLSEEARLDDGGPRGGRVWIVDPLDGTREFSEGRSDFAVHVALVEDGIPTVGAVALPAEHLVLDSGRPPPVPPRAVGPLRIVVSRTRPPAEAATLAAGLHAETVPMGSAGAKAMAVLRGHADVYLHAGGQYEWDSAAPVAVALAAGLHASRLDGAPLVYGRPDPWLPDLLVCRPELARQVLLSLQATP